MNFHTEYLTFHTKKHREYIHLTPQVEAIVKKSRVKEGMVLVSAMHITAGVYVNDNESGLIEDTSTNGWRSWRLFARTTNITTRAKIMAIRT